MSFVISIASRIAIWSGKLAALAIIPLLLLVFANAVLRYVFGYGSVWLYEAVLYCFVIVMAGVAGWTMVRDEHVRVDILYAAARPRRQGLIDVLGCLLLLVPFLWVMWDRTLPYVGRAWAIGERSMEISGLPFLWLLKTMMLVFIALLAIAGLAFFLRAVVRLSGRHPSE
ncbi:TRAP transporter small permease subunit [Microbaculum sp. FT89]|uniref:TRAP transporter small permease subunit n=1 Tax=Microbaculum sp. FT89 TaxID=3447298 RepID=UPI003F534E04